MWHSYPVLVTRRIFAGVLSKGTAWGGTISGFLPVAGHFIPGLAPSMNDLTWQVPVFAFAGALIVRIGMAPYELWKEQTERAEIAERERDLALDPDKEFNKAFKEFAERDERVRLRAEISAKADAMRRRHAGRNMSVLSTDDALAAMWDDEQNGVPVDRFGIRLPHVK